MPSLVLFNGVKYLLSKIRVQAATGRDIAIKREEVVLSIGDTHYDYIADPALPQIMIDASDIKEDIPRIAVIQYSGKYYVMSGHDTALEKFKESKSGTIKAKLLSKHMLKKCDETHEGAVIVTEAPPPPRREYNNDRPRSGYNSSIGYNNRNTRDR
jgi:hypothetical protein